MSIEVKDRVNAREEPALMTTAVPDRLAWPAAALIIVGLSVAGWFAVGLLMGLFLR